MLCFIENISSYTLKHSNQNIRWPIILLEWQGKDHNTKLKCELVCNKYLVLPEGGEDKVHLDEDASKR